MAVQPCRQEVMTAVEPDSVVSCTAAQWICSADAVCATALKYYDRFCSAMFRGRRCSER